MSVNSICRVFTVCLHSLCMQSVQSVNILFMCSLDTVSVQCITVCTVCNLGKERVRPCPLALQM